MTAPAFRVDSLTVFRIAVPMTLAFMTTPIVGAVDTAVVGQLGEAALLGGIAVGAIVFDVIFSTFNFLRSGTTGLTAQALGADDKPAQALVLLRALVLAVGLGVALVILSVPVLAGALAFLEPSAAVAEAASTYYGIRILSAPFALANYAILGWVLGLGRAGLGLALQTLLNGINIAGSIWLGLGLGWGVEGVAYGTLAGEVVACVVGVAVCLAIGRKGLAAAVPDVFRRAGFGAMIAVNGDIMVRSFALLFAFALFTRTSAGFGDVTLAANALLMNFFLIGGYFLDGLANAAEQLAGRAVGARRRDVFVAAVRLTIAWGFVFAAVAAGLLMAFGGVFIDIMTTAPDVREAARAFLPWAALTPLAGVLAFQMDGVYIGATWSREMRNMMLASVVVYLLVLAVAIPVLGNHGLWLALLVFLGARGITLSWRLKPLSARTFPA
ncbi:MATE family efflux transporter [Mongoliimonas terrestris]|uniref:MATE family efflux transporter n=1 Tax=Mongoliimonas terrestris TaxID=1709001 RepID=UPI000949A769|nr:MATE family efflux transporter [Mongoliimonas terrestris]